MSAWGCLPGEGEGCVADTLPVNRMTDRCKKSYLAATSWGEGGRGKNDQSQSLKHQHIFIFAFSFSRCNWS